MMNRNRLLLKLFLPVALLATLAGCTNPNAGTYKDTSLPFLERAEGLVSEMTLQEKIDMLRYDSPGVERLGIPAHNFWNECLHGVGRSGRATVFSQAIGMAAMWDDEEMGAIAEAISDEARAKHHEYASRNKRGIYQGLTYWTPNINIFRDPRWGRGMETYGEDPYLTAGLAVPFIRGLQGDDPQYLKLVATAKHFAVHSGPESTRHSFDVWPSDYDMAETYLPHFKRAVQEAKVYSVMCAYQSLRGAPCCGSLFLENLLRTEWGFEGYIVSDCWAIADFFMERAHHVTATPEEAAAMAVKAGTDQNCGNTYLHLGAAVEQGLITEEELNLPVTRILTAMMKLGMFDPEKDVKYTQIPYDVVDSKEHQALSLDAARKSMVLLKNEGNLLPFSKEVKKVAVIGPNADDQEVLLGNYNGYPSQPKTPLTGLREKLPQAQVIFAQGCPLAEKLPYFEAIPADFLFTDETASQKGLKAEYFANKTWEGTPAHTQTDPNIDFVWWTTPPFEDMAYDDFSVRWTGWLIPPVTGEYALGGEGFSGFNLYLNDSLVTRWKNEHHPRKVYELMHLEGGKAYNLRVEYLQDHTDYAIMRLLWDTPKPHLKQEAVELAASSDLVILCMGLSPLLEGEEMPVKVEGFAGGDRLDIRLPETQTELIREIHKLGKPTVLVLLNGSALAFNWEAEHLPAIIEAWYPGQQGGAALADVIFGDYNPAGRLPVTFYKDIKQIPAFDNYDMQGKTYRYFHDTPLYEFGYGLSYTTFAYRIDPVPASVQAGDALEVSVEVRNTGQVDGDEVVQLYVSLPGSPLKTPIRSLQGFKRIHLKAGEAKTVNFTLEPLQIAARDTDNRAQVLPGKLLLSVGGRQPAPEAIASGQVAQQEIEITGEAYYAD
ncbi:MAG: glycoside hydrolase family 3 C-terminal domain-containing protein [Tannerellaceae bacterium]|jgi:beta-glucosidase|nr:glycoside hydrolase family 3 C-terminal domain-containing protein [Tannerellaceae bacterium]